MINDKQHTRGLTLIEILISIFLFGLISLVLFNVYQGYFSAFGVQQARIDTSRSARTIVNEVEKVARQANHIVASHTFSGTTMTTSSSTAVFELPSVNSVGDIVANTYDYIAFYTTNANMYVRTEAGSGSIRTSGTKRLSDIVNTLAFTYSNSNLTQATSTSVEIRTQTIVKGSPVQAHLYQVIHLRNL